MLALFRPYEDNVLLATMMFSVPLLAIIRVVSEKRKYVEGDSRTPKLDRRNSQRIDTPRDTEPLGVLQGHEYPS